MTREGFVRCAFALAVASGLSACGASTSGGGGSGPDVGKITVDVQPSAKTLAPLESATFSATVVGTTVQAVTWSVEPTPCGTVTQAGVYTAPASVGTCVVRARSKADVTATDTATVTVAIDSSGGAPGGGGTDYHVGPGQAYTSIGAVPWYALRAGDTVYIHWRSTPYREKFLISGQGTPTQWIRVRGVPGTGGALPIVSGDGATTSTNMHWRWQTPNLVQWDGVISIAPRTDDANGGGDLPRYIEIAGLQVQDGFSSYSFTAENGATSAYEGFAACIYARSAQHVLVRDNVLTNCGQGFYNWTGDGASTTPASGEWWDGLAMDLTLRQNYLHGNGNPGSYTEHQIYTEALGVVIEANRFGPMRTGALGSQLKDRSAGTVVRYNWIERTDGWMIDLVEPQESWATLGASPRYGQDFVYGNVLLIRNNFDPNIVHWNEDHQAGQGRSIAATSRLYFYDNTLVLVADAGDMFNPFHLFNETWGAYECPAAAQNGRIDVRNNILASQARTSGASAAFNLGYCSRERVDLGKNWISPAGTTAGTAEVTGAANLVSPAGNAPGFSSLAGNDLRLVAGASAANIGGALAAAVTSNALGLDLTPTRKYAFPHGTPTPTTVPRSASGVGSDAGAFEELGAAAAAGAVIDHATVDASVIPTQYLDAARTLDVYFQHKSVGTDITDGLRAASTQNAARYALNVVGWPYWWADDTGGHDGTPPAASWYLTHDGVGSTEDGTSTQAATKTTAFNAAIRGGYGATVGMALMKFCFEEIWSGTGLETWNLYRPMMEGLIRDYPGVTFVWTTMPLPYVGGQADPENYGLPAYEFNNYVRAYVAANGGYLLDVADLETYSASGTVSVDSRGHPSVSPDWAAGAADPHLNAAGSARMANAWWNLTARVAGWRP